MNRDPDKLADARWVAQCARRLREQWPHADVVSIDETAVELWHDESLRAWVPIDAAVTWLRRGMHSAGQIEGSAPS